MAADGIEAYQSRDDHIVAEFGDGHDVQGIAARYGLTVAQVYAVVEREVGPPVPGYPGQPPQYPPPAYYAPPPDQGYYPPAPAPQYPAPQYPAPAAPAPQYPAPQYYAPPQPYSPQAYAYPPPRDLPDEDAIVAAYADGHAVGDIARQHGLTTDQVYQVVQRVMYDNP
ncbi:helix-turn-helix domain-containing protein [Actinoplanes awajinensis]|uniref:Uncharacterized protein n=1 Tax=Actinoplanes awajinensis subsp. mycoplanecinus TaxID=135947 RepID=A0A101JM20_9ACTN|nr:helix-turn-helix domain-containing protein [Actinoplanes awajinensis]KUL28866.1 hypothetical protein ADL15_30675 [Actinoplanes awajinensis subsp. mycoplanecinus]